MEYQCEKPWFQAQRKLKGNKKWQDAKLATGKCQMEILSDSLKRVDPVMRSNMELRRHPSSGNEVQCFWVANVAH